MHLRKVVRLHTCSQPVSVAPNHLAVFFEKIEKEPEETFIYKRIKLGL